MAQWLARMVWDHEVGGSNPLTPTIINPFPFSESSRESLFTDSASVIASEAWQTFEIASVQDASQ